MSIIKKYRCKEADGLVKDSWQYSEPEAGQGADATDGASGYFSPLE
jgi:hypothetical protein